MKHSIEKRGQKLARKWTHFSRRASLESKEHLRENVLERISHVRNVRLLVLEWILLVGAITFLAITQSFWYTDSYATITYTTGGTYTEATLGKVNSLNPLFAATSSEKTLSKLLFGTLAAPDYSGHTGINLASSISSLDESGQVWLVQLRSGLKWSDGAPITSQDILYTIKTIQDPKINTSYSSNLAGVKAEARDDGVVFVLPAAYANFPSALDFPLLPAHILQDVAPELLLENTFSSKPITSGAFNFNAIQTVNNDGEKIVYLTPNANYYNGQPMLDSFVVHAYTKLDDIKDAIKTGAVTATAELSASDGGDISSLDIYEKQSSLNAGVYAFFNMDSAIMSNKALRQAIRLGLNMDALRAPAGDAPALNYPFTSTQLTISDPPALPVANVTQAREAIKGIELPADYKVSIVSVSSGHLPQIAEIFAQQLESLGIPATTQIFEPNQDFLANVIRPRAYDVLIYEIELGPDPDFFAYYHASQASPSGLNLSNYRNKIVDDLILAARSTLNLKLRDAKYQTFLKHWIDDVPAIGIYQANMSYYYNKNVRTYSEDNRLVYATDRFVDIPYWASEKTTKNRTP